MRPPDWQSTLEIHPAGWACPAVPFWIAGWAVSPSGLVLIDVRAWLDDHPVLGLAGLPRPDAREIGFSIYLQPRAGTRQVRIEFCDQHGRWTEVFSHAVASVGTPPLAETLPQPDIALLLDLLRARHARPTQTWAALADEVIAAQHAEFIDIMPSEPFKGALEQMETRVAAPYGHMIVTGWVAHRTLPILRLTALLDTAQPQPLLHGLDRPDAGSMFAEYHAASQSRFAGFLRLPVGLPRPLALRIFAETADGARTLVFLKRVQPVLVSGAGADLPAVSRWTFFQAVRALNRAAWQRRWTDPVWRTFLAGAWRAFRACVPAQRLPTAPPVTFSGTPEPLSVTLVTHNLNFEGAPLFLFELACHLAAQPGWQVRLVSAQEGPLRTRCAANGLPVTIVAPPAGGEAEHGEALAALAEAAVWTNADIIIANTILTCWAIRLARLIGKPNLLYIHESAGVRRFFALDGTTKDWATIEHAIATADHVAFPAADGQRAHAYLNTRGHFRALPGWVDVQQIQKYIATHDRAAQRRSLDLPEAAVVFAHIGSFLPRKGLHVFVAAIREFLMQAPSGIPVVFLLVGAKDGPDAYLDLIRHAVTDISGGDIRILPQSPEPYRYFQAADVFVCASLEEVFPRVVLEASVFGRSIVTTDVNGIPEMLGPNEAWLVPSDDASSLANAMHSALAAHLRGDTTRAHRAQKRVMGNFDTAIMLPRHTALIRATAGLPRT
jgi:glycosyltransferase involved in cell wall biosynthesis